ncbi:hypothetical protein [Streptomyces sp. NPDC054786]
MGEGNGAGARLVKLFREVCGPDDWCEEALGFAEEHLDRAAECDTVVAAHGVLIPGTRGTMVINPAVPEARRERAAAWAIIKP